MISLTTDCMPLRDRAEFWADLVSRHVTPVRIEPAGDHALHGEIQARAVGDLGVAQVSGQGVRAEHTGAHIARATGHVLGCASTSKGTLALRAAVKRLRCSVGISSSPTADTSSRSISSAPGAICSSRCRRVGSTVALRARRPWRDSYCAIIRSLACGPIILPPVLPSPGSCPRTPAYCSRGSRSICWLNCCTSGPAVSARHPNRCAMRYFSMHAGSSP